MAPNNIEALLDDLQAVRTHAEALRWRTRVYLAALQQSRQRLAREVARARRGWELPSDRNTDEDGQ